MSCSASTPASAAAPGPPLAGAAAVRQVLVERGERFAPFARPALVNGTPGFVVGSPEAPSAVVGFTVVDGLIVAIDLIIDPDKLRRLQAT